MNDLSLTVDRQLQMEILREAARRYPAPFEPGAMGRQQDDRDFVRAAVHLSELDLLEVSVPQGMWTTMSVVLLRGKAKGIDFLQADGGLSAALGVVTVRLDAETLRALITDHIESAPVSEEEKKAVKDWVRGAGAEALAEAVRKLVGAAIDKIPQALQLLTTVT